MPDAVSADRDQVPVDLALQGGGAHGAFTWGVLDRLLEQPQLRIEGISGTSAGATGAAVLSHGHATAESQGARSALEDFWRRVARAATFSPFRRSPLDILMGRWTLDNSPLFLALDLAARVFSPYDPPSARGKSHARHSDGMRRFCASRAIADPAVRDDHQRAHRARPASRDASHCQHCRLGSASRASALGRPCGLSARWLGAAAWRGAARGRIISGHADRSRRGDLRHRGIRARRFRYACRCN